MGVRDMATNKAEHVQAFLIRPLMCECEFDVYCDLCTAIQHLGGAKADDAFEFSNERTWKIAVDLLCDQFGNRLFEYSSGVPD